MQKECCSLSLRIHFFHYLLGVLCIAGLLSTQLSEASDYIRYVDPSIADIHLSSAIPDCVEYSPNSGSCADGSSKAYRTTKDVNNFINTLESGDTASIYFKRGGIWTINSGDSYLKITKKNVFIGAFGSGNLPVFDGKDTPFNDAKINLHAPLIQVSGQNCTLDSIRLINSYGSAIRLSDVTGGLITKCQIDKAGWAGVAIAGTSTGITVELCNITKVGYRGQAGPEPDPEANRWPQAINANTANVGDCLFRYNHIYNCYTEGIGASGNIVEYNLIGPTTSAGIYAGEKSGIIRYNFCYGTIADTQFFISNKNGRGWTNDGISLNEEKYVIKGLVSEIYGNIVVGRLSGIRVMNMSGENGKVARIYNNTFIDNAFNFKISKPETWKIQLKNNLSIINSTDYSKHISCGGDTSGWDIGPNQWSSIPEDQNWYNVVRDEISYPELKSIKGWYSLKNSDDISFDYLIPTANSSAVENPKAVNLSQIVGYQDKFLTSGTVISTLAKNLKFKLESQNTVNNKWNFGAIVGVEQSATASLYPPKNFFIQ